MDIKRLWHSLRLYTMFNSRKRGDYLRKKQLMHHVGTDVRIPTMLMPLFPELISIGDNVEIASGVKLVTHDAIHGVLSRKDPEGTYPESIGCIDIGSNCFIGAGTVILGNVKIGDNVVIGAGSLVNKDLPANSVCGGVPAKVLGSFDDLMKKRSQLVPYTDAQSRWAQFHSQREE